jgi:hypothetical protein
MNLNDFYTRIAENPWMGKSIIIFYFINVGIWGKQQRKSEKSSFGGNPSGTIGLLASLIGLISILIHYNSFKSLKFDLISTYCVYFLFGSSILKFFYDFNSLTYSFQHKLIKGISIFFGLLVISLINKVFKI